MGENSRQTSALTDLDDEFREYDDWNSDELKEIEIQETRYVNRTQDSESGPRNLNRNILGAPVSGICISTQDVYKEVFELKEENKRLRSSISSNNSLLEKQFSQKEKIYQDKICELNEKIVFMTEEMKFSQNKSFSSSNNCRNFERSEKYNHVDNDIYKLLDSKNSSIKERLERQKLREKIMLANFMTDVCDGGDMDSFDLHKDDSDIEESLLVPLGIIKKFITSTSPNYKIMIKAFNIILNSIKLHNDKKHYIFDKELELCLIPIARQLIQISVREECTKDLESTLSPLFEILIYAYKSNMSSLRNLLTHSDLLETLKVATSKPFLTASVYTLGLHLLNNNHFLSTISCDTLDHISKELLKEELSWKVKRALSLFLISLRNTELGYTYFTSTSGISTILEYINSEIDYINNKHLTFEIKHTNLENKHLTSEIKHVSPLTSEENDRETACIEYIKFVRLILICKDSYYHYRKVKSSVKVSFVLKMLKIISSKKNENLRHICEDVVGLLGINT